MEDHTVTPLDSWKALARAGKAPADAILHKQYVADSIKAVDGEDRKVSFTISTGAIDRDRDTLKADGWKLDSYRKNPVVLWAHDSRSLPIAKAEAIRVQASALKATAEFVPAEDYPFAETVLRMLKGGFLRATSVGFIPLPDKYKFNEERAGFDFMEQELLEFSVVPVPSNPDALTDAKAAGIDTLPLRGWAEKMLDEFEPGQWIAKADLAQYLKALSEPRIIVPAFNPEIFVTAARSACEKRGRVLSQANEERIRRAQSGAEDCASALAEVMGSMPMEEPDDMSKAPFLYVTPKATLAIDPQVVVAAVQAAVSETVRAEVNAARGRLD